MALPSLEYTLEVSNLDGSACETFPASREDVKGAARLGTMSTALNVGFQHLGGVEFAREDNKRYNSPRIMQTARVKHLGETDWEGEVSSVPQSRAGSMEADGYYVGLKDVVNVAEVYRDMAFDRWGGIPLNWRSAWRSASYSPEDGQVADGALVTKLAQPTWSAGALPVTAMVYTAPPGVRLGNFSCDYATVGIDATHVALAELDSDDVFPTPTASSDIATGASPQTGSIDLDATESNERFVAVYLRYPSAYGTDDSVERSVAWSNIVVKGDHGLTNIYASEVIKHVVGKYAPYITADSKSIVDTTFDIGHLVFDGSNVADVIERCNAYHLWEIAVWENRRLHFAPPSDRTDYDFLLSTFRGDERDRAPAAVDSDEPCNGLWVYYTDVATGRAERVGPFGTSTLHDADGDTLLLTTNANNPCVREGRDRFPALPIGFPCTRADAILIGSLWLAERQIRTYAGTGNVGPYVRNRAGQWVPASKIRAGHRVKYVDEPIIRRVYSTSHDFRTGRNGLVFEKPPSTVAGIQERIGAALMAAGIA